MTLNAILSLRFWSHPHMITQADTPLLPLWGSSGFQGPRGTPPKKKFQRINWTLQNNVFAWVWTMGLKTRFFLRLSLASELNLIIWFCTERFKKILWACTIKLPLLLINQRTPGLRVKSKADCHLSTTAATWRSWGGVGSEHSAFAISLLPEFLSHK